MKHKKHLKKLIRETRKGFRQINALRTEQDKINDSISKMIESLKQKSLE